MSAFLIDSFNLSSKGLPLHSLTQILDNRLCGARLLHYQDEDMTRKFMNNSFMYSPIYITNGSKTILLNVNGLQGAYNGVFTFSYLFTATFDNN